MCLCSGNNALQYGSRCNAIIACAVQLQIQELDGKSLRRLIVSFEKKVGHACQSPHAVTRTHWILCGVLLARVACAWTTTTVTLCHGQEYDMSRPGWLNGLCQPAFPVLNLSFQACQRQCLTALRISPPQPSFESRHEFQQVDSIRKAFCYPPLFYAASWHLPGV